ncbi:odorant receptor 82a-like isoform X2 [Linepithema humile]|uniref:odorant receptor 82a-like isoform X2 n=1 Tax=Linepithema humile TaxID=83485 RepID=UPI00351F388C
MDVDNFFQNSHYSINRILLSIYGLWPFDTKIKRYMIYITMILVFGSGFIFQILGTIDAWQDPFELVDSLTFLFLVLTVICKMICGVYMVPKIKLLLIKMQEYNLSPKSNKECEIHNSYTIYGQKMATAYLYFITGNVIIFYITVCITRFIHIKSNKNDTLLNEAQVGVVYRVNYIVDFDTYYPLIYIHTSLCLSFNILLAVTLDILSIAMVEHCRGLFAVLSYRLENTLSENDYDSPTKTFKKDKSYLNVACSFRRHAETIEFVNMMNAVYSPSLFAHLGLSILVLGILEYQVVTSTENTNRFLKHISFLNSLLINVFFENWQGQRIIDSSEKVFDAAYNAKWYNMPIAARKLLVLIMMKSKKPLILTAGKFMILSYVTFNGVSMSILS